MIAHHPLRFLCSSWCFSFPQQCWTLYNEYLRCGKKQGVESKKCQAALNYSKQICTGDQVRHHPTHRGIRT